MKCKDDCRLFILQLLIICTKVFENFLFDKYFIKLINLSIEVASAYFK